jgi:hypothetical protein
MQMETNHFLGQFQHKYMFHVVEQAIKEMHRLQHLKRIIQIEEGEEEDNVKIIEEEKLKGHRNQIKNKEIIIFKMLLEATQAHELLVNTLYKAKLK